MLQNFVRFFDNPDQLCLSPNDLGWSEPLFELHSLRESLLGLTALVRFRNSRWAAQQGRRMLETVRRLSRPDGSWDLSQAEASRRLPVYHDYFDPTGSNGRLIEALVEFHRGTGDSLALELADRFACHHLEQTTNSDGTFNASSGARHTHSYLGTLRGLLLYGELIRQRSYVERVRRTYDVTVKGMVKLSGFTPHDIGHDKRGETSSPGDAAQLALWLARSENIADIVEVEIDLEEAAVLGDDVVIDVDQRVNASGGHIRDVVLAGVR